jgi:hypothetical protein
MPTPNLYRVAGTTGVVAGVLIAFNVARRAGIVPTTTATHAISTLATALALPTLTALYLHQRKQVGTFGLIAFAVNFLGLAGVFAIEFATHAIFPYLTEPVRTALLDSGAKGYFLAVAALLLVGAVLFGVASWRARAYPAWAITLYVVGLIPAALRTAVPAAVYEAGLLLAAAGTVWLSTSLWRNGAPDHVPADRRTVRN